MDLFTRDDRVLLTRYHAPSATHSPAHTTLAGALLEPRRATPPPGHIQRKPSGAHDELRPLDGHGEMGLIAEDDMHAGSVEGVGHGGELGVGLDVDLAAVVVLQVQRTPCPTRTPEISIVVVSRQSPPGRLRLLGGADWGV